MDRWSGLNKNLMSYGTIHYEHKTWQITCEPHVAMHLKRVFAGLGKQVRNLYKLSDTLENARNLQWFTLRYPMEVDPRSAARLQERAAAHIERATLVSQLLSGQRAPREFALAVPARPYQQVAASMGLAGMGLLLADDVGLGKTVSFICTLCDPRTRPALVVTLAHLPRQWQAEINRFMPELKTHILKGVTPYDITASAKQRANQLALINEMPDVIITNYHKLHGWAETLGKAGIRSICFDEVQELRRRSKPSDKVLKYEAAKHIAGEVEFRMGLTATPVYNFGNEMYSILNVLAPGFLGKIDEFETAWCSGYGEKIVDPKAFGSYLRDAGIMLRRTRSEVGRELPPLSKITQVVDTNRKPLEEVSARAAELARMLLASGAEDFKGQRMQASEELSNALRRATGMAKAPYVAEFVRLLLESEDKIVVFAWHRGVYTILMDLLKAFKPVLYTGTESPAAKEAAKNAFVKGESRVILISLRSGAGLDGLQFVCRTCVVAELDWSPGVLIQCIGRLFRDGQPDPVAAYFLVAETGADPTMMQTLGIKRQQSEPITDPDRPLIEELQADDGRIKRLAEAYLAQLGTPVEAKEASA